MRTAVILAAGLGSRLASVHASLPKSFVEVAGESLIARSVRLLRERGIARVVVVTGHLAEAFEVLKRAEPIVEFVHNPRYATLGSMASLACALGVLDEDVLLLEGDLFYEARALDVILGGPVDALLISGATHAGDEVFVEAPNGLLHAMSKDRATLARVDGELVGISRLSREVQHIMMEEFVSFERTHGHARMAYETDALVFAARRHPVHALLARDLLWGEIDDEAHLRRVREEVAPRVLARERAIRTGA